MIQQMAKVKQRPRVIQKSTGTPRNRNVRRAGSLKSFELARLELRFSSCLRSSGPRVNHPLLLHNALDLGPSAKARSSRCRPLFLVRTIMT